MATPMTIKRRKKRRANPQGDHSLALLRKRQKQARAAKRRRLTGGLP